jgi:uncharacterized DUF497 family protein
VEIVWDKKKNERLIIERGLSFDEVTDMILSEEYLDILENPKRTNQLVFVLSLRHYTHAVPFIIDENERIVLKTIFPSRKLHKKYGGR